MTTTLAFAVLAWTTRTACAHGDAHMAKQPADDAPKVEEPALGREGDPKRVTRTVKFDMTGAFRFTPADVTVERGETVKFVAANSGKVLHKMVLGTSDALKEHAAPMMKFPHMEHADANMARAESGAKGQIVWHFTKADACQFACRIPGRDAAGMVGKVVMK